jgi:hypothetical protein
MDSHNEYETPKSKIIDSQEPVHVSKKTIVGVVTLWLPKMLFAGLMMYLFTTSAMEIGAEISIGGRLYLIMQGLGIALFFIAFVLLMRKKRVSLVICFAAELFWFYANYKHISGLLGSVPSILSFVLPFGILLISVLLDYLIIGKKKNSSRNNRLQGTP